ncbi:MAG: DNA-binding response regulator [Betaproteobacteria bacterium]|nr:MAG: DNA-binding response regulator [Betaproteobacteria bacterium]
MNTTATADTAARPPLRIIIADDEPPARRRLFDLLDEMEESFPHRVVAEVENGKAAIEAAQRGADVILLDINMPEMDGLEAARHLLKMENAPRVIFITAYDQHALEAFEVQAVDYLLKPVRRERLIAALERAKPLTEAKIEALPRGARRFFSVSERGKLLLVPADDVIYFRAEQKYITVLTADREFLIEDSLTKIDEEFGGRFIRIHRNCLARADLIESFERDVGSEDETQWIVTLRGRDERLLVSRRQHSEVRSLAKRVSE